MMRHLDLATGTADEEINEGTEESAVKLDLWENQRSDVRQHLCSRAPQSFLGGRGPSIVPGAGDSEDDMSPP
ncbi:unnamed protein product [Bubo scandiacus]